MFCFCLLFHIVSWIRAVNDENFLIVFLWLHGQIRLKSRNEKISFTPVLRGNILFIISELVLMWGICLGIHCYIIMWRKLLFMPEKKNAMCTRNGTKRERSRCSKTSRWLRPWHRSKQYAAYHRYSTYSFQPTIIASQRKLMFNLEHWTESHIFHKNSWTKLQSVRIIK